MKKKAQYHVLELNVGAGGGWNAFSKAMQKSGVAEHYVSQFKTIVRTNVPSHIKFSLSLDWSEDGSAIWELLVERETEFSLPGPDTGRFFLRTHAKKQFVAESQDLASMIGHVKELHDKCTGETRTITKCLQEHLKTSF